MSFNLTDIQTTGAFAPPRVIVYGVHGVGKSTFASNALNPVFIQTEDGLSAIKTNAFPLAKTFDEVIQSVATLHREKHDFKTLVLDSLDWTERLIWEHASKLNAKENIEDFGYGKGYVIALEYWRQLIEGFNALRNDRGMTIVLTAHSEVKRFDAPDSEPYDRYQPKMHKLASAMFQEWCDVLAFANYKVFTTESDVGFEKKRTRAHGHGERRLYTMERASHIAKSRYRIAPSMKFEWPIFANAIASAIEAGPSPAIPSPAEAPTVPAEQPASNS